MGDNQRAKHGQPNQPGGKGPGKNPQEHSKGTEGNQNSTFAQGGKGDQKQEDESEQKAKQERDGHR